MTQVSKYYISRELYDKIFDLFLSLIVKVKTKKSASDLIEEFLTPTERIMFSKRLTIGVLIAKGYDYRQISNTLKVSTATVNKISVLYKYGKNFKSFVDSILLDEELKNLFAEVGEGLATISDVGGAKAAGWRSLKNELRQKRLKKPF